MHDRFELVLVVNHACNLRCTYCYTGDKAMRPMPWVVARAALHRALCSVRPGGTLELGFFGGEPLLEAALIRDAIALARRAGAEAGIALQIGLTTNGVAPDPIGWEILLDPGVDVAVSHDGLPAVHDAHRVHADGRGSSDLVLATLRRLRDAGRDVRVVSVVRPSTVARLPEGIAFLRSLGVRRIDLSLDLWTRWDGDDAQRLEHALARCAIPWAESFPDLQLSWFDEEAVGLLGLPVPASARCGFGRGQVAVTPAGRLYPCERLVGDDPPHSPFRLPGHVQDGTGPLGLPGCAETATCRCSNVVRSGDPERPDGLLRFRAAVVRREVALALQRRHREEP